MFLRLNGFLFLLVNIAGGSSSILAAAAAAAAAATADPIIADYCLKASTRYPAHAFIVGGKSVEGSERVEAWHQESVAHIKTFSQNTFGKLAGRNWALASVAIVYEKPDSNIVLSKIHTFPHLFGSGVSANLPEPAGANQIAKQATMEALIKEHGSLYFADEVYAGATSSERIGHFIHVLEPIIMGSLHLFVSKDRSEEKIRGAFAAWRGGGGDKNLCRNWFTDSEQVILAYVRTHHGSFMAPLMETVEGKPLFMVLNIVTLNDMCGICFRSVYIHSRMESGSFTQVPFITGINPYGSSRTELMRGEVPLNIELPPKPGTLSVKNVE